MNTPWGQHFSFATTNVEWDEVLRPRRTRRAAGRAIGVDGIPVNGRISPSDAPGFGIELTLAQVEGTRE